MTTLLVAATGGHLAQLHQLRPLLMAMSEPVVWVTFDNRQSRSLLAGERVEYVPYVAPRDYRRVLGNIPIAQHIIRKHRVRQVISTGSAIALSFLPIARAQGIPARYIESAARSVGPSTTGRLLSLVPGVRLSTQYARWAGGRWGQSVSVFDGYRPGEAPAAVPPRRVVVTLGTIEGFGFRALLEQLLTIIPSDVDVLWQTGVTEVGGLDLDARPHLSHDDLQKAMRSADVVVAHAGIGSALAALDAGHKPVLVPRRARRSEHIDDHQEQIARELDERGLALRREVPDLRWSDLVNVSSTRIIREPLVPLQRDGRRSSTPSAARPRLLVGGQS
jgi:UDP-N-acetylglucosamine--N-acetylmuramyl-(pentapeptide) pyrophosphoryl-undecaprenol N-acetylglucosamine transferase